MQRSCLIVGAGMAGLSAGGELRKRGWGVTLLDKGRAPGGRMATRRIGQHKLDHGAQFFTVRDARFREVVTGWEEEGLATPWFGDDGHVRYRGVEGMNSLTKRMAEGLDVRTGTRVVRVEAAGGGWSVVAESGQEFQADALLLTPPSGQSADLMESCAEIPAEIVSAMRAIEFDACLALLVVLDGASRVPAPGYVRPDKGPVEWIADNTQKGVATRSGARSPAAALTIHARADFSRMYFETAEDQVTGALLQAADPWLGSQVVSSQLHRWKYAKPVEAPRPECLFVTVPAPLAVAGDAFGRSRVEAAFLSGLAAAEKLAGSGSPFR